MLRISLPVSIFFQGRDDLHSLYLFTKSSCSSGVLYCAGIVVPLYASNSFTCRGLLCTVRVVSHFVSSLYIQGLSFFTCTITSLSSCSGVSCENLVQTFIQA